MADIISALSFLIKRPKSINPLGILLVAWERSHTLCEPMATRWKHCFSHPETRKIERKLKIRNNTGTLLLCARSNLWGEALSANRLRLKCCKRQCWPFYKSEFKTRRGAHTPSYIRLSDSSYMRIWALFPYYKAYHAQKLRHSCRKQNTRALIKQSPKAYKPYFIMSLL